MKIKLLYITLFLSIVLAACQNDNFSDSAYDDMQYLSLPEEISINDLSSSDLETVALALSRVGISENSDGLYKIKARSGREVNISENLYRIIVEMTENSNRMITEYASRTRTSLLSDGEGSYSGPTDCMAHAISHATGSTYGNVNSWITTQYGNDGVPYDKFQEAASHFGNGSSVDFRSMPPGQIYNCIIVIEGGTHAVNAQWVTGDGYVIYKDYQNGLMKYVNINEIMASYQYR